MLLQVHLSEVIEVFELNTGTFILSANLQLITGELISVLSVVDYKDRLLTRGMS